MTDIHSQTGTLESPLATLEEQLSEKSKEALRESAEAAFARAPIKKRASWWWSDHVGLTLGVVFVVGLVTGAAIRRSLEV